MTTRSLTLQRCAAVCVSALFAWGGPLQGASLEGVRNRSSLLADSTYVPLSMGTGAGYALFNTDPFGGFNGRYCTGPDAIVYTPNNPSLAIDEVDCLTRLILMVAGQSAQTQDLLFFYRTAYHPVENTPITSDTHTATSRDTVFSVVNLGLTVHLTQTVVSPAKLEQVYEFVSAADETLLLINSMDADINWNGNSNHNFVFPGIAPEDSVITADGAQETSIKMTGANSGSYQGYHTASTYQDPTFESNGATGWLSPQLNNGISFGDAHTQLQWSAELKAGVPFVHTTTIELPGPLAPACPSMTWVPALNEHGLLLFEDLWPIDGDLDFNDQTVAFNYAVVLGGNGLVSALQLNINVLAVGAKLHNGLYLHLPLPADAASSIVLTDAAGATSAPKRMNGEYDLVLELAPDTLALFAVANDFQNTLPDQPAAATKPFQVRIDFATHVALDPSAAPYDLFIARSDNFGHQIHLMNYAGTQGMDTSLFRTGDDDSKNLGSHFLNKQGLPFVLCLPQQSAWPTERTSIELAYSEITAWAASAGVLFPTWYQSPNASEVFTHGVDGPAPVPVIVEPALTAHCP